MRIIVFSILAVVLLQGISGCGGERAKSRNAEPGWVSLFDGKSLEGWVVHCLPADRDKEYWKVAGGCIECNSMGDPDHDYVWLATEDEYDDFHIELEFQLFKSSPGNSGVQFRSRYDDSETARNGGWMNGPQVDIHGPITMRTGLIYDETEGVRRWIQPSLPDWNISSEQVPEQALKTKLVYQEEDPGAWNRMEIICKGMHVETLVNGNRVAEMDGDGIMNDHLHRVRQVGEKGCFALQLHSRDQLLIRFRNIRLKEI